MKKNISRGELVETISKSLNFSKIGTEAAIKEVFNAIQTLLIEKAKQDGNATLEIRGFGLFYVRSLGPHTARDPRTGEPVFISSSKRVGWKPCTGFKNKLREDKE